MLFPRDREDWREGPGVTMVEGEELEREKGLISGSKRKPVTHIRAKASSLMIDQRGFNLNRKTQVIRE